MAIVAFAVRNAAHLAAGHLVDVATLPGAGNYRDADWSVLDGRRVLVMPDGDFSRDNPRAPRPGQTDYEPYLEGASAAATRWAREGLEGIASEVREVRWDDVIDLAMADGVEPAGAGAADFRPQSLLLLIARGLGMSQGSVLLARNRGELSDSLLRKLAEPRSKQTDKTRARKLINPLPYAPEHRCPTPKGVCEGKDPWGKDVSLPRVPRHGVLRALLEPSQR